MTDDQVPAEPPVERPAPPRVAYPHEAGARLPRPGDQQAPRPNLPRVQPPPARGPQRAAPPAHRAGDAQRAVVPPAPLVAQAPDPAPPPRYSGAPIGPSGSPELLRRTMTVHQEAAARTGWRRMVGTLTGGRIRPGPGAAEAAAREQLESLRRPFGRPMTVMVANPKGGAGKTPTTLMLGATLGRARGGYVLAWDNNETRGTLGLRAHQHRTPGGIGTTVWDLLSELDSFETVDASIGALSRFVRPQETLFDVLASDEDAARMAQIGREEVARLHRLMARFYRVIVVDTGNNLRAANWQAISEVADALVVVTTYEWDTAYSASWMLDHLCAQGRGDLVARAVTVLTASERRIDQGRREDLVRAFDRTAEVVEVPFDRALRGGGEIAYDALRESTRQAWSAVASAVCHQLAAIDLATSPARALARTPVIGGVPLGGAAAVIAAVREPVPTPPPPASAPPPASPPPASPPPASVPGRLRIGPTVHLDLSGPGRPGPAAAGGAA